MHLTITQWFEEELVVVKKNLSLYLTDLFNGLKYHLKEDIILNLQYFWLKWYTTKIMTKAKIKYLKIHYWLKEME